MTEQQKYTIVGIRPSASALPVRTTRKTAPWLSLILMGLIVTGCLFAELLMTKDPGYLDLANTGRAPCREFLFGTDALGRDIFSCIWYGGRVSLIIGFLSTAIAVVLAVLYGAVSGISPNWLDSLLMRLTEIFLSVPSLLVIVFVQAVLGKPNVLSISLVIGITGWCSMAKVVRTEVRQLRNSEYVVASKAMGGGFFHILLRHLAPNFVSSIMFMVVMSIRSAIAAESTLSFMGMGLPLDVVSWGSMLSLAEKALMSGNWWVILIPGGVLVTVLMCMTNIGNWLRRSVNRKESNL